MTQPRIPMFRYRLVLVLLAVAISTVSLGQISQPDRVEFENKNSNFLFTVLSMNNKGIALFHQLDKFDFGKNYWEVIVLDTALRQTWSSEIELSSQLNMIGYEIGENEVYFLFRKGTSDNGALHLIQANTETHDITHYEMEPNLEFKLAYFSMIGKNALLGGYVSRQPAVFLFDLASSRSKVVPGFFIKNTELIDLRANRNGTFNALLIDRSPTGKKQLSIRTMDETGALIVDDMIEIDGDKAILSGITSTLEREELLVAGTWGQAGGKTALGIFTVAIDPFNKQEIHYYSFAELNHFLEFSVPKKANRIKSKTARRKKDGKLPKYSVYVNAARLAETAEGFVFLSEVYSPMTGGSNSGWNYYNPAASPYGYGGYSGIGGYSPYGYNPYASRYSPYSYGNTHRSDVTVKFSSVVLFDGEGKLIEDTGMKIDDLKLPTLDQVSDFTVNRNEFIQVYRKDKNLYVTLTERDDKATREQTTQEVKLKSASEFIRNETSDEGSVRYWFGPNLFIYGYESIKEKGGDSRRVFYVNKISVDK